VMVEAATTAETDTVADAQADLDKEIHTETHMIDRHTTVTLSIHTLQQTKNEDWKLHQTN
jgi:hypothetical protein